MKIGIMQPYIFPYIGYFQLINAVDTFVFYDDVNYIKGGWINRNNILVGDKANMFTISLNNPSSFNTISETKLDLNKFEIFKLKFLRTIEQSYKKAPLYKKIYPMLEDFFLVKENILISEMAINSVVMVSNYLGLQTDFKISSINHADSKGVDKADRLITISKKEMAKEYINPIGGQDLYNKEHFKNNNIKLHFIQSEEIVYKQFKGDFVPWLSIIDVLMFNSKEEIQLQLNKYTLV
ncbi:WbqC family protein [Bizionia paragorgiae]|uniref:WbqC family protein n=1 Tax=Bizionia paragorgiae TaxID=283786 RepID=UPI003A936CA3